MNGEGRRSDWLVLLGIGLVLWGGWWLLNGFLAPLLWPLRALLDAIARIGWPLSIIVLGVLLILSARRGGQPDARARRLCRSRTDRMVGGVVGGAADYFDVDSTLLRVIFAAFAFFTWFFPAFVLYVIAMIVIPEEPVTMAEGAPRAAAPHAPPVPAPPLQAAPGPAPAPPPPGAPAEPPAPPAPLAPAPEPPPAPAPPSSE